MEEQKSWGEILMQLRKYKHQILLFWPHVYFNIGSRIWWKQNNNYVLLYTIIIFQAMTITCSQLSDCKVNCIYDEFELWDDEIWYKIWYDKRYDKIWETDVSRITRRCCVLGPRTSRNCASENSKYCFSQAKSHACISRNAIFQKTTTVDIKIMYTKMYTNKIHEIQNFKFLQNKHCCMRRNNSFTENW